MGRSNRRSILGQQIAEILGTARLSGAGRTQIREAATKGLICGSVALLVAAPAQVDAVGLGEITVESTLGRPLQAVVPLRVGTGETLPADCVKPGTSRGDLTKPGNLRVKSPAVASPGTYNLRISSAQSLHEPMYELSLVINCPGTPLLVRHYVLMLDLPGTLASTPAAQAARPPSNVLQTVPMPAATVQNERPIPTTADSNGGRSFNAGAAPSPDRSRSLQNTHAPIQAGTTYRISQGDTLSTIAARIDGRLPDTTWAVAEQIFASNPNAFIRNNPDLIKLGSLIQIPGVAELASSSSASAASLTQQATPAQPAPEPVPQVPAAAVQSVDTMRSESSAAMNTPAELVLESDLAAVEMSGDVYQEVNTVNPVSDTETSLAVEPDSDASVPVETEDAVPNAVSSPFADEESANSNVNDNAAPISSQSEDAGVGETGESGISPWLAIGAGLLIGLAVSLFFLRERLLAFVLSFFSRRDDAQAFSTKMAKVPRAPRPTPSSADDNAAVDAFDTLAADAAFDTAAVEDGDAQPLKIGDPMEKTYIVETADHEPTQEVGESPLERTDTSLQEKLDVPLDPIAVSTTEKSDDEMLAEIFEDASEDALGVMGTGMLEPTAQLPNSPEDEIFDPSGDFPGNLTEDIIDPTTDMPLNPTADVGPTLMQAFTEDLDKIEPDFLDSTAQIDGASVTVESEHITNNAAEETSLDALPNSSEEDDMLSETLYDALTLLDNDYEDEFTASQILERTAIKKSLADLDEENDDDDDTSNQKLTG